MDVFATFLFHNQAQSLSLPSVSDIITQWVKGRREQCYYSFAKSESTGSWIRGLWRRHQMETFSELLAICAGNSPVSGEFLAQRPVTRRFNVFCDLRQNKRLSKQSWGWWFETLSCPLRRHRNATQVLQIPEAPSALDDKTDINTSLINLIFQARADVGVVYCFVNLTSW